MARRRNPPADIMCRDPLGGECAIFALATAAGTSVPNARAALLNAGIDVWGEVGYTGGLKGEQIQTLIDRLDLRRRILEIGWSCKGKAGKGAAKFSRPHASIGEESTITHHDCQDWTVLKVVARAKQLGASAVITVTTRADRVAAYGHMVGWSPRDGFVDIKHRAAPSVYKSRADLYGAWAKDVGREHGPDWWRRGDDILRGRQYASWFVLFRGEP